MPRTQQRAARNRRPVRPNTPDIVPQLVMRITSHVGNQLRLYGILLGKPEGEDLSAYPLVLQGVPQVRRVLTGEYPVSATLADGDLELRLTYPGTPLTDADSFALGQQDQALRTRTGGYAAPFRYAPADQPLTAVEWTASVLDEDAIRITFPGYEALSVYMAPFGWFRGSDNARPTRLEQSGQDLDLYFESESAVDETIQYSATALTGPFPEDVQPAIKSEPVTA